MDDENRRVREVTLNAVSFDYKAIRKRVHDEICSAVPEESEGVIGVTGWVLILETTHEDGVRGLFAVAGDTFGERDLTPWHARGMLQEVSEDIDYYIGPDVRNDDEEDDDYGEEDDD